MRRATDKSTGRKTRQAGRVGGSSGAGGADAGADADSGADAAGESSGGFGRNLKDMQQAEAKCERLLAARERSSVEIYQRLVKDGYSVDIAQAMVERLVQSGIVDDERFCRLYIQSKQNQGWGMRRITYQLSLLGIKADQFIELFDSFSDDTDELARATDALSRYRGRSKDAYAGRYRYLSSRGFKSSVITQVLRTWRDESDPNDFTQT